MSYEIQDNNGVIHSSSDKIEIDTAWDAMTMYDKEGIETYSDRWETLKEKYKVQDWEGDLKLVQVHRVHK